ncbi:hypothetical protein KOW79_021109 [Hemibagrus wyckioides]|uniref:Uncharacterized protein n=1 Tax=Hemibagrus wyckioides TaxID=337641 RepID=A0A9D3S8A8_9TELE|nr:hypothetical protein KOW79_021109 [Hemibagrus wyckioides]
MDTAWARRSRSSAFSVTPPYRGGEFNMEFLTGTELVPEWMKECGHRSREAGEETVLMSAIKALPTRPKHIRTSSKVGPCLKWFCPSAAVGDRWISASFPASPLSPIPERRRGSRIGRLTLDGLRFFPRSGGEPQLFRDTMNPSFGTRGRKE